MLLVYCLFLSIISSYYGVQAGLSCNITINGSCYIYVSTPMTWTDAENNCVNMGGHLTSIHSDAENAAVNSIRPNVITGHSYSPENAFIGCNDRISEDNFRWTDGSDFSYTNWDPIQPDNSNNEDCCSFWHDSDKWNDRPCTGILHSICKIADGLSCDIIFNGSCYIYVSTNMTWTDAEDNCIRMGGHLTSIHSDAENAALLGIIPEEIINPFIGCNDLMSEGNFIWSDGSNFSYTNWSVGEPNNINGNEDCCSIRLIHISDGWNDAPCTIMYHSICKVVASSITLLNSTNALCEQDIVQFSCTVSGAGGYQDSRAGLSINGSSCTSTPFDVNVNEPRVTFTDIGTSTTAPSALYTVSPYLAQDNATQYRCCAQVIIEYQYTDNLILLLAVPPYPANLSIYTTYDSATSCNGTITLTWPAVTSDRAVNSYEVLLDGTNITTLSPTAGTNTYTTSNMSLATFNARYTVRAVSCAGSSVSNEVVFTPNPPDSFTFAPVITCFPNNSVELNISLPTVISDRAITQYKLYINNKLEDTSVATGSNYEFSEILQVTQNNHNITVIAYSCAGSTSYSATETVNCFGADMTTIIVVVVVAVGTCCFISLLILAIILLICCGCYFVRRMK